MAALFERVPKIARKSAQGDMGRIHGGHRLPPTGNPAGEHRLVARSDARMRHLPRHRRLRSVCTHGGAGAWHPERLGRHWISGSPFEYGELSDPASALLDTH